jgi:purine nucleoside phosphorylase
MLVYKQPVEIRKIMNTSDYFKIPGTKTSLKIAIEGLYQRKGAKKLVRKMMCNLLAYIYNSTDVVKTDTIGLYACGDGPTDETRHLIEMYERMGFEICAVGKESVIEKILNNEDLIFDNDFDCSFGMSQDVGSLLNWCENTLK